MAQFRVALLQMASTGSDEGNLTKAVAFCRAAASMGADLALFPEMWNVGYSFPAEPERREELLTRAIAREDAFYRTLAGLAPDLGMAIAFTYLERWNGDRARNTVTVVDLLGREVLSYAKVHTCDFSPDEAVLEPGEDFLVADLDTRDGVVRIGAMICYDREFPESARVLMLKGAEVILVPNACPLEENRLSMTRTRSLENMVGVATANYAAPDQNGHSVAFEGVWCEEVDGPSIDPLLVEAGSAEGIHLAPFDLERLRAYRQREAWGNAYRKPSRYSMLVSAEVRPPFERADARR